MKIGVQELLIVLVIVIVIFGPTQIPKLAKMFGKSAKKFKEGMDEVEESETVADQAAGKTGESKASGKSSADGKA